MNESHDKLIAKIQHFYDICIARLNHLEDFSMCCETEKDRLTAMKKVSELNWVMEQYCNTFDSFLYQEGNEAK